MIKKELDEEKDENKEEGEEGEEEEEKEEGEEGEGEGTDEKEIDAEVDKFVAKIEKKLGLSKVKKLLEKVETSRRDETLLTKIFGKEDISKDDVKALSKEEKIVGFFLACVRNDKIALKALSEGTSADGGYLVPTEFRAELIRDLEEPNTMRSLVRVVPMLRMAMNIPTLAAKPKVYWTAENTSKYTTSAEFGQKTLTAYKVAAINRESRTMLRNIVKNAVNCWKTLTRAISSQAVAYGY